MPTLLEARDALSPYIDNGVCSTDSRVVTKINEAQRRLHSHRTWLGVMARYSVAVSNNQFTLPGPTGDISTYAGFGLESANRVTTTTASAGFLTNNVQTFLVDSGDVLALNFAPSSTNFRTYTIQSGSPSTSFVEVTGKLNYQPAVLDTDLLIVGDLDALKLMILAIHREENNQLEMARELEQKAIERLSVQLERTLEAARHINYQAKRANYAYGTLGYVRSRLALDVSDGLRMDDLKLIDLINKAQDILVNRQALLLSAGRYGVKDGLTIPVYSYVSTDSTELPIKDYDVIRSMVFSLLIDPANEKGIEAQKAYREEAFKNLEENLVTSLETKRHSVYEAARTSSAPYTFGYMKARLALDLPNGLKLSSAELSNLVNNAEEKLFTLGKWYGTIENYKISMTLNGEILLPPSVGTILAATMGDIPQAIFDRMHDYHPNGPAYQSGDFGYDMLVDRGEEYKNGVLVKKYFVRNSYASDTTIIGQGGLPEQVKTLNILAKKRWLIKNADSDKMDIRNYPAIRAMAMASFAADPELAKNYEQQAIDVLKREIAETRHGRMTLQIQPVGFGGGEITHLV